MTLDTTKPFRLGFLTHVHGAGRTPAEVYRDLITVFQAAEDLGFDGGWVAQHHLRSDYGRLPSPPVLLAAVAERTTHLQLGTAVTVLAAPLAWWVLVSAWGPAAADQPASYLPALEARRARQPFDGSHSSTSRGPSRSGQLAWACRSLPWSSSERCISQ